MHKLLQGEAEFKAVGVKKVQTILQQIREDAAGLKKVQTTSQQVREDAAKSEAAESDRRTPPGSRPHGAAALDALARLQAQASYSRHLETLENRFREEALASQDTACLLAAYAKEGRLVDVKRLLRSKVDVHGVTSIGTRPINDSGSSFGSSFGSSGEPGFDLVGFGLQVLLLA